MSLDLSARIVRELAHRGYNADREAVTLLGRAENPEAAIDSAVEAASEEMVVLSAEFVADVLEETAAPSGGTGPEVGSPQARTDPPSQSSGGAGPGRDSQSTTDPSISTGNAGSEPREETGDTAHETKGSGAALEAGEGTNSSPEERVAATGHESREAASNGPVGGLTVSGDIQSTGTGDYGDFVSVFRDRYEQLADPLPRDPSSSGVPRCPVGRK